ncbi:hypothetical protein UFOVP204_107 [uncultured Caudovirales phage]|uniref:Uncharacterized protein n=1 Tax=uncultured Caudovirales phage TaxID=2100421 RepID=A0A6J7WNK1_9CAUD|nr:hypothetical protein UFOVP204_107 [uncultured Caudovirales phage]
MASVPLSVNQLEIIAETVARELLEQWAINDRFTENELESATKNAVDDTAFVINKFMDMLNDAMLQASQDKSLII